MLRPGAFAPLAHGAVGASGKPKQTIVVLADGGWDVMFAFDPKLGLDSLEGPEVDENPAYPDDVEYVRTFGDIPIICN